MRMPGRISLMFLSRQLAVESAGDGEIDLGDHRCVGGVEEAGILERLVFAFGHAQQHNANALAQVVARRADEVADIFNEEIVEPGQRDTLPAVEML